MLKTSIAYCSTALALFATALSAQPALKLVPDLQIRDAAQPFAKVGAIATASNGDVYIAHLADQSVRVFDRAGVRLRVIGKSDSGGVTFRSILSIGFIADTLYVTDAGERRVQLMLADGSLIRVVEAAATLPGSRNPDTTPIDSLVRGLNYVAPIRLLAGDRGISKLVSITPRVGDLRGAPVGVYRVNWNGAPKDRILSMVGGHDSFVARTTQGSLFVTQPFVDDPVLGVSSSGERMAIAVGDPSAQLIRITDINANGDTTGVRSITYKPQALLPSVADSTAANIKRTLGPVGQDVDVRAALYVPAFYSAVSRVLIDDDGTLWLRTSSPIDVVHRWTIVSPAGQALGTVWVDKNTDITMLSNGAWGVVRGADSVLSVVRYRIQ